MRQSMRACRLAIAVPAPAAIALLFTIAAMMPAAAADKAAPAAVAAAAVNNTAIAPHGAASLATLFSHPVLLRGSLAGKAIEMRLGLKPEESAALEGSYLLAGQAGRVLLAGEFEQDALMMEESINGKDVSGLWDGVYDGRQLTGNWSSVDGEILRAFVLTAVPVR